MKNEFYHFKNPDDRPDSIWKRVGTCLGNHEDIHTIELRVRFNRSNKSFRQNVDG